MAHQQSQPVTVPASFVHRKFSEMIRRVYSGEEHFIIERDGLPVAVLVSVEEYRELMREREEREERVKRFQQLARDIGREIERRGLTEEEVMAELEKTREQVFQKYYGRQPDK
jgi:prevent-host-death family protein